VSQYACNQVENDKAGAEDDEELGAALGKSLCLLIVTLEHNVRVVVRVIHINILAVSWLALIKVTISQLRIEFVS